MADKVRLDIILMFHLQWTLYQLKYTSTTLKVGCFLFLSRMFKGTIFTGSAKIYSFDEEKNCLQF